MTILSTEPPIMPFDIIIFGATGDLVARKILPALFQRYQDGQIPSGTRIIGSSRRPMDHEAYKTWARDTLPIERVANVASVSLFLQMIDYIPVDAAGDDGWVAMKETLAEQPNRVRVFYYAVSPDLYASLSCQIAHFGLIHKDCRVVVEKPIGHDSVSASKINSAIGEVFQEGQIYRIDHYLGKETVQNLMALRFGNALFEPLWNSAHIDHVQITVAETLGVGNRADYYDGSGALRDMVQNHLLQLLCLIAMEPPALFGAADVRAEKLKILRALRPIEKQDASRLTVRGQYTSGAVSGAPVAGYAEELGRSSATETFVALKASIDNWRWAGVPFYLRTGKRMHKRVSDVIVTFKPARHNIFSAAVGEIRPNRLVLRLQPDDGIKLELMIKEPGLAGMKLRHVPLDMSFALAFQTRQLDAYERLLIAAVRGDTTLFMHRDEVQAAWDWCDPILESWQEAPLAVKSYAAGTWGPSASVALIERDERSWQDE